MARARAGSAIGRTAAAVPAAFFHALLWWFARRRLAVALDRNAAAFTVCEHVDARLAGRMLPWLFGIAVRAVELAP
jgi:hypothetical protein